MLPSREMFSPDPKARLNALQQYSKSLEEAVELRSTHGNAYEAFLQLVVQEDPDESVRRCVLSLQQCPKIVLQHSLNNGNEEVRGIVITAIGNRRSHPPVQLLLQHIPLESSVKLITLALGVFNSLLQRGCVTSTILQRALGIHSSPTDPLENMDCENVLRSCARHEQPSLRIATADVLVTLVAQEHTEIAKAAFCTLQQLVRDGDARVAKSALSGMAKLPPIRHELKLSEACVRAMLARYYASNNRDALFKVLAVMPCYSLRTYAILQMFLKRRLYEIEMQNKGKGEDVEQFRRALLSVLRRNQDFVRVLDLKESETHKMMRLLEP